MDPLDSMFLPDEVMGQVPTQTDIGNIGLICDIYIYIYIFKSNIYIYLKAYCKPTALKC